MIDRTIPYYHIIMRCDRVLPMEIKLPEGYTIRTYQPGDEDAGAQRDQRGYDAADGQHRAVILGAIDKIGQLVFTDGIQGNADRLQQADAGEQQKGCQRC